MIITLAAHANPAEIQGILTERGLWITQYHSDQNQVQFLVSPSSMSVDKNELLSIDGISDISTPPQPYPELMKQTTQVTIGQKTIGINAPPVIIAGPCSIESAEQIAIIAEHISQCGVTMLRGGIHKPRTSPYSFQGYGEKALQWLNDASKKYNLSVITEALGVEELDMIKDVVDVIQIGSRNMQNTPLLRAAGKLNKPILLKRGMAATIKEWLFAAETCLLAGSGHVLFCERGIRGFDPQTRNLLDLGAVSLLAHVHSMGVIVDPSHAVGRRDLLLPLSQAAVACGASGIMLEVHHDSKTAKSDGPQALSLDEFTMLANKIQMKSDAS